MAAQKKTGFKKEQSSKQTRVKETPKPPQATPPTGPPLVVVVLKNKKP